MATINFYLSAKEDDRGSAEILMRFSLSKTQRYRTGSGLYVPVKRWGKKNEVTIPKIEGEERTQLLRLSERLQALKKFILDRCEEADKESVTKQWLERVVDEFLFPEKYQETEVVPSFFDIFEEFLLLRKMSEVRKNNFKVVLRALRRYELYKQKTCPEFVLTMEGVTREVLLDIEHFMMNEHKIIREYPDIYKAVRETRYPKPRGQNTMNDIMGKIRTFYIWSNENDKTEHNPFEKYSIEESVYGTPVYITVEERNKLYKTDMSDDPALAVQRDIFVFQSLIGCRIGDYYRMTHSNVIKGAIEYVARKTKDGNPVTVRVPMNAQAKEIYQRYYDPKRESIMPFILQQDYNEAIKRAFTVAGLTRGVTVLNQLTREGEVVPLNQIASSHLARRTFIGNIYKQVKDQNLVSSLSGHKEGSKAFARYREIDDEIKTDLVNLLL